MEESELKKQLNSLIPSYTRIKINRAKKLLEDLNTENIEERLINDIEKIDKGEFSLHVKKILLCQSSQYHLLISPQCFLY